VPDRPIPQIHPLRLMLYAPMSSGPILSDTGMENYNLLVEIHPTFPPITGLLEQSQLQNPERPVPTDVGFLSVSGESLGG